MFDPRTIKPVKFVKHTRSLEEQVALYTQRWRDQIEGTPCEKDIPLKLYLKRNASKPGVFWTIEYDGER